MPGPHRANARLQRKCDTLTLVVLALALTLVVLGGLWAQERAVAEQWRQTAAHEAHRANDAEMALRASVESAIINGEAAR